MAKKAAAKTAAPKVAAKPMTKAEVLSTLAETTELSKSEVGTVFEQLEALIGREIGKKGPGSFNVPGLMKITVQRKPATKATTKKNPFKPGEMMDVKAKPARNVVKVRPLKGLKDLV